MPRSTLPVAFAAPPALAQSDKLVRVYSGARKSAGLSTLENNMIATILDAARESARTGESVRPQ